MIAYFDTSALVPLLVDEPSSSLCARIWDDADAVITARSAYVEVAAALAQAEQLGRISHQEHRDALGFLDDKWTQLQLVEIDQKLMIRAAQLAEQYQLRGYDATHCAAAEFVSDEEVASVGGDAKLLAAWRAMALATINTNGRGA